MADTAAKLPIAKDTQPTKAPERLWHPIETLRTEIDRLFDDFGSFGLRTPLRRAMGNFDLLSRTDWSFSPAFDMTEQDGHFEITAEIPGIDEKNIELKVANGVLTIKGEKSDEKKTEEKDYHLSERRYGTFLRSFELPGSVDVDKIDATFAKGVLSVKLPKTAESVKNEKKIEIKAA
jgi:HSP20 family protein